MELNRKAEVSLHAQAADMEFTLERRGDNDWKFVVAGGDNGAPMPQAISRPIRTFTLTNAQASATLALFIGELESDLDLNAKLYAIAETVWSNVEQHFRPIP